MPDSSELTDVLDEAPANATPTREPHPYLYELRERMATVAIEERELQIDELLATATEDDPEVVTLMTEIDAIRAHGMLSQQAAGAAISVHRISWIRWERQGVIPLLEHMQAISKWCGDSFEVVARQLDPDGLGKVFAQAG